MSLKFEPMTIEHSASVMEIFNYYIEHSMAAYPESPLPESAFCGLLEKAKGYPAYVIIDAKADKVVGFCLLHAYNPLPTFKHTAEVTYFLSPDAVSNGIGTIALRQLEQDAHNMGITKLLASISSENAPSLSFHKKHGFTECGRLHEIGRKLGKTFDVVWMEKSIA